MPEGVTPATVLWVAATAAVALLAAVAFRRVGRLAADTHQFDRLKAEAAALDRDLGAAIDPLVACLDEVRRGSRDPAQAVAELESAGEALRALSRRAAALRAPQALADRAAQIAWEVDRAVRAADMAAHGLAQIGRTRHDAGVEAQTSLKRGTLGLRHAREAVAALSAGIARLSPAEVRAMPPGGGARATPIRTPAVEEEPLAGAGEPPGA